MGKSRPLCFTSVFWLSDAVHIHDRDKVHLKKTAVSCRYEIPFRIGIMGRTVSNSQTAIYGRFKLINSSGIRRISCNSLHHQHWAHSMICRLYIKATVLLIIWLFRAILPSRSIQYSDSGSFSLFCQISSGSGLLLGYKRIFSVQDFFIWELLFWQHVE